MRYDVYGAVLTVVASGDSTKQNTHLHKITFPIPILGFIIPGGATHHKQTNDILHTTEYTVVPHPPIYVHTYGKRYCPRIKNPD